MAFLGGLFGKKEKTPPVKGPAPRPIMPLKKSASPVKKTLKPVKKPSTPAKKTPAAAAAKPMGSSPAEEKAKMSDIDFLREQLREIQDVMGADEPSAEAPATAKRGFLDIPLNKVLKILPPEFVRPDIAASDQMTITVIVDDLFDQLKSGRVTTPLRHIISDIPGGYLTSDSRQHVEDAISLPLPLVVSSMEPGELKRRTASKDRELGVRGMPNVFSKDQLTPKAAAAMQQAAETPPPAAEEPAPEPEIPVAAEPEAPVEEEIPPEIPVEEEMPPEAPVEEEIPLEAPVAEEPVAEEIATEPPVIEEPVIAEEPAEEFTPEEPPVEEAAFEEPALIEEPAPVEEPVAEKPIAEEPVQAEKPFAEEFTPEEPPVEEAAFEEPALIEEPVAEKPIAEEPVVETPAVEELVAEEEEIPAEAMLQELLEEEAVPSEMEETVAEEEAIEEAVAPVEEAALEEEIPEEDLLRELLQEPVETAAVEVEPEAVYEEPAPAEEMAEASVEEPAVEEEPSREEALPVAEAPAEPAVVKEGLYLFLHGVDLNEATVEDLVSNISGLSHSLAENIVTTRQNSGQYFYLTDLLRVPGLGRKTFERLTGQKVSSDATRYAELIHEILGPPKHGVPNIRDVVRRITLLKDFEGCIISHADGYTMASSWDHPKEEALGAFTPQMFKKVAQYISQLDMGALSSITFTIEQQPITIICSGSVFLIAIHVPNRFNKRSVNIAQAIGAEIGRRMTSARDKEE